MIAQQEKQQTQFLSSMNHYNKLRSLIEGATNVKPTQAIKDLEKRAKKKAAIKAKADAIAAMRRGEL